MRNFEADALHLLGEIAAGLEPPALEEAEQHYRQALVMAEELGMRPLVAHCHLGLARLHRRTHERDQAHEHFTTATTMYREMGMLLGGAGGAEVGSLGWMPILIAAGSGLARDYRHGSCRGGI